MALMFVIAVVLVIALVGSFPKWPHSREWGYYPTGLITVIILVLLMLLFTGHLHMP
jgi:hypothetical protein